ncbi:hypothetical protein JOQ06_003759, partial [Pogonophryne albipinna]
IPYLPLPSQYHLSFPEEEFSPTMMPAERWCTLLLCDVMQKGHTLRAHPQGRHTYESPSVELQQSATWPLHKNCSSEPRGSLSASEFSLSASVQLAGLRWLLQDGAELAEHMKSNPSGDGSPAKYLTSSQIEKWRWSTVGCRSWASNQPPLHLCMSML